MLATTKNATMASSARAPGWRGSTRLITDRPRGRGPAGSLGRLLGHAGPAVTGAAQVVGVRRATAVGDGLEAVDELGQRRRRDLVQQLVVGQRGAQLDELAAVELDEPGPEAQPQRQVEIAVALGPVSLLTQAGRALAQRRARAAGARAGPRAGPPRGDARGDQAAAQERERREQPPEQPRAAGQPARDPVKRVLERAAQRPQRLADAFAQAAQRPRNAARPKAPRSS